MSILILHGVLSLLTVVSWMEAKPADSSQFDLRMPGVQPHVVSKTKYAVFQLYTMIYNKISFTMITVNCGLGRTLVLMQK